MKATFFLSALSFLLLLHPLAFSLSAAGQPPVVSLSNPNILFVAIDDFNDWGPTQLDGAPFEVDTPNFDALADRGILFTNAHCNAPSCNPSRTSIMSGLHPASTGVYANGHDWLANERFDDILLLPEYFQQHGYTTLGGGKIYHANQGSDFNRKGLISPRGWKDFFPSFEEQLPVPSMPDIKPNRGEGNFNWGGTGKPLKDMGDHKVVNWAIDQLETPQDKPLFLAVGIYRPHMPWFVPDEFYDHYEDVNITPATNPVGWKKNIPESLANRWDRHKDYVGKPGPSRGYAACVTYADFELGRLLRGLEASPLADNTIVVIWSDHGWHLGEKDHFSKFTLWEESTRVPLLILKPGANKQEVDTAVSLLDVYPTLIELAGLPANKENDGQSLLPIIESETDLNRAILTSDNEHYHAVRDGRYRYLKSDNAEALFDHFNDPREFNNIANQPGSAAIIKRLSKSLPSNPAASMPQRKKPDDA
ncbi:MAG: sulfatase [Verrucomicrobia bacterium]|nr:sulfatase [Verrucomicrobiota bacterium]MDA1066291.1 sulfatase [Verrucomicrobiota bacterium]